MTEFNEISDRIREKEVTSYPLGTCLHCSSLDVEYV